MTSACPKVHSFHVKLDCFNAGIQKIVWTYTAGATFMMSYVVKETRKVQSLPEIIHVFCFNMTRNSIEYLKSPPKVFCETQTAQQRLPWLHRSKEKEPLVMVGKSRRMDLVGKAPPLTSRQSTMKCMKETGKAPLLSGSPSMWPSCGGRGGQTRCYVGGVKESWWWRNWKEEVMKLCLKDLNH